jgi:hypothetical protein
VPNRHKLPLGIKGRCTGTHCSTKKTTLLEISTGSKFAPLIVTVLPINPVIGEKLLMTGTSCSFVHLLQYKRVEILVG